MSTLSSKCSPSTFLYLTLVIFTVSFLIYSMAPRPSEGFWETSEERVNISWRRRETAHLDCGRILRGDTNYTSQFTGEYRIPISPTEYDMSCRAIQSRVVPFKHSLKPLKVGVAFARVVYKDYEFLEKQLQSSYHFQNQFCYSIDSKSTEDFKWRMWRLGRCLPNVIVVEDDLPIDSAGHNMNFAHYSCMEQIAGFPGWGYLVLMQNHDVIGKTVYELSRIFDLLDGANDIEIDREFGRIDKNFRWDLKSLALFRDDSKNSQKTLKNYKGAVQGSLSRAAVEWMVKEVDPYTFMDQWNQGRYGVDEQWLATFQANDFLGMPGHFTGQCANETDKRTDFISRWSKWAFPDEKETKCGSKTIRHGVCLLGIEDFGIVAKMPNIMFNKMMPSFDYSIVECTAELLYNRTFSGQEDHKLEEEYYTNMVNVIYHKNHHEKDYELNCTPSYQPWNFREYPVF